MKVQTKTGDLVKVRQHDPKREKIIKVKANEKDRSRMKSKIRLQEILEEEEIL